jgi:hypothetical protein
MHTGPKATFGYDLALTEVLEDKRHYFVVEVGTGPIGFVLRGGPSRRQSVMSSAHMHSMLARSCVREGSTIITLNGHEPVSYAAYDGTNPFA